MVAAMDTVIGPSSGDEKNEANEQVDSLRVDSETAEPAEPPLPKLASAWARLQEHVAATFNSHVSTCGSAVSQKTKVCVEKIDRSAIMCSHAVNEKRESVVAAADAQAAAINATHEDVARRVAETREAGMAKLATARAETMRKVEETHASVTETYDKARESVRGTTALCMIPAGDMDEADAELELTPEQVEQLREAFSVFDKNGNGKVTADELSLVMEECGEVVTEAEIKEMIKDVSVDGTIDFDEFKAMMTRLAAEEAGLPLSKRIGTKIAKVPLKMRAQWKAGIRHAHKSAARAHEETSRAAAEKVKEAEESMNSAVEKTKQVAVDAKQSTVGWIDSALASVIESWIPQPEKKPPAPVLPTLGSVGDMDDTSNAYVW